jgi:hypothetical protein
MLVKQTAELPIESTRTRKRPAEIPRKRLAAIATSATSLGSALMSRPEVRDGTGRACLT